MSENLIIIGASTPTILRIIDDINEAGLKKINLIGFLDNNPSLRGKDIYGHPILGDFTEIHKYEKDEVVLINTIASSIESRIETTEYFVEHDYKFTNIVAPSVNTKYVIMGVGNLVYENALIHPYVEIRNHCIISSNSGIAHETLIKDYCFIGPASYICGKVMIDERVFIGAGAKILQKLKIEEGAVISACSLINKSVTKNQKISGIPGKAS